MHPQAWLHAEGETLGGFRKSLPELLCNFDHTMDSFRERFRDGDSFSAHGVPACSKNWPKWALARQQDPHLALACIAETVQGVAWDIDHFSRMNFAPRET